MPPSPHRGSTSAPAGLHGLLPELLFATLVPYIGPTAAVAEMHKAAAG